MFRSPALLVSLLFLVRTEGLWAAPTNPYEVIDQHALSTPKEAEQRLDTLARHLIKSARNDREKVRAIYRWVTDRIAYDAKSLQTGLLPDTSPPGVLKNRLTVCEGYANLFGILCVLAKLEVSKVVGVSRSSGEESETSSKDHAWNSVRLEGKWHLIDPTWGAGAIDLKEKTFVKRFSEFYFLTPPERLLFSHFPADPRWQLVKPPVTAKEFETLDYCDPVLFDAGITATDLRTRMKESSYRGLPRVYALNNEDVKIVSAPIDKHLQAETEYTFTFTSERYEELYIVNSGKTRRFPKEGDTLNGKVRLQKGKLIIGFRGPESKGGYNYFLEYVVE
jgi:transglutaminase/protease-like cytokinesis protein 3